jgi:hypothetical protein
VSDSRLSAGATSLTDRAAKILELPVVLLKQDDQNIMGRPIAETRLGFAYAGSSLIALQTYAAVLPLWRHLMNVGSETLPSIEDCANNLAAFLRGYAEDLHRTQAAACECAVFGWCPSARDHRGYALRVELINSITDLQIRALDLSAGHIEILGVDKERFFGELRNYLSTVGATGGPGQSNRRGEPPAKMGYRGFEGKETRLLGDHIINLPGML